MEVVTKIAPIALALIMLALGLGLTGQDFLRVAKQPKDFLVGLICQLILLPIIAFLLLKIFNLPLEIALGVMMLVIYALSSFANASFLNPSDTSANCPKLELELVIEASAPFTAVKCLLYPIANTDTICIIESFVIVI